MLRKQQKYDASYILWAKPAPTFYETEYIQARKCGFCKYVIF
jgi:hypothetical protein